MKRFLVVVAVTATFVSCMSFASTAQAQTEDRAAAQLARAWEDYERGMDGLRDRVHQAIRKAREDAKRLKDGKLEAAENIDRMERAFDESGQLPDLKGREKWEQEHAHYAREVLLDTYANVRLSASKVGSTLDTQSLSKEVELVLGNNDLVSWREKLSTSLATDNALSLSPANGPLEFDCDVATGYRLEIRAARKGDSGKLMVSFPCAEGKVMETPVLTDRGVARLLLTVASDFAVPLIGSPRPFNTEGALEGSRKIRIRVVEGEFKVESVRWKPLISGTPPETGQKGKPATRAKEPAADPSARLAQGSTWTGKRTISTQGSKVYDFGLRVLKRQGNTATLSFDPADNKGAVEVNVTINGQSLTVTGGRFVPPANSNMRKTLTNFSGSGTINGPKMSLRINTVYSEGSTRNQPGTTNMELTAD